VTKTINVSLPRDLIKAMDEAAKAVYATRSEYVRQTVVARLRMDERLDKEAEERSRRKRLKSAIEAHLRNL
jgi:metal-responsive CopG/Arc/MetJ family transcriptional regulator